MRGTRGKGSPAGSLSGPELAGNGEAEVPRAQSSGSGLLSAVVTESAPAAIGPYVQGMSVASGCRLVFTSGQLPLDPVSGTMVDGGVAEEALQALRNALAILAEVGARGEDVVRATIYLVDMAAYPIVNDVYERVFEGHWPARTVVGVSALPRGASLEVELVAAISG